MYSVQESSPSDSREFFRCPIDADQSAAKLKLGWGQVRASVLEKSIDGFSVLIKKRYSKRLRVGQRFEMKFDGTKVQVEISRIGDAEKGYARMALDQTKDLTKPPRLKSSWWPTLRTSQKTGEGNAQIAFAGLVLVLFCAMAMPGLGDRLGTADRIEGAFKWILKTTDAEVTALSR